MMQRPILLVEDDQTYARFLAESLKDEGFTVMTAANGLEVLRIVRSSAMRPAVILLDSMMPVLDGYGFLDERRKTRRSHPSRSRLSLPGLASIPVDARRAGYNNRPQAHRLAAPPERHRRRGRFPTIAGSAVMSAASGAHTAEQRFQLVVESVRDYAIFALDPSGRVATLEYRRQADQRVPSRRDNRQGHSIFYAPEDLARGRPRALLDAALSAGRVEDEVGVSVRTAAGSGPTSSSRRFEIHKDSCRVLSRSHAIHVEERRRRETAAKRGKPRGNALQHRRCRPRHRRGGRVTRINPVAERLTGWSEREAVGRPIDEVFAIINEDTRAKAPNPVRRVLAEGVVVGLANHTALISRDGTERPIADSGAPIRDAQGVTRGRGAGLQRRNQGTAVRRGAPEEPRGGTA